MIDFDLLKGTGQATQVAGNVAQGNVDMRVSDSMAALQERMQDPDYNLAASTDFATIMKDKPELANNLLAQFKQIGQTDQQAYINDFVSIRDDVKRGDMQAARERLEGRIMKLQEKGRNPVDSIRALKILEEDPSTFVENVNNMLNARAQFDDSKIGKLGEDTASIKNNEYFMSIVDDPSASEEHKKAARIALKLEAPPAGGLWAELLRDDQKLLKYIQTKGDESESKEAGKQKAKFQYEPKLKAAMVAAEKLASERGEVFNELARLETGMPTLTEAVDKMKKLSETATFTGFGKAYDAAARELFGISTEGSKDLAKLDATIDNIILPLLKPTFGAAFTVAEGDRLRQTIASAGTPEEKISVLDTFLENKEREIRQKQAQVGALDNAQNTTSDDDLINKYLD